ncbi:MAG: hypothetical protein OXG35_23615 [Acidobacteria bacterium]|nr:hypothetical protein [Acidobacteriota bacterium]
MDRSITLVVAVAVASLAVAAVAVAQDSTDDILSRAVEGRGRFQLFTGCARIRTGVNVTSDDDDYGFTWDRVMNLVESRTRAARLYGDSSEILEQSNWLTVSVWFSGLAVFIEVEFEKGRLADPASGLEGYAQTWRTSRLGTHGRNGAVVMQTVSELVDEFILAYLRVHEDACG